MKDDPFACFDHFCYVTEDKQTEQDPDLVESFLSKISLDKRTAYVRKEDHQYKSSLRRRRPIYLKARRPSDLYWNLLSSPEFYPPCIP